MFDLKWYRSSSALCLSALLVCFPAWSEQNATRADHIDIQALGRKLEVGDVVFIRVPFTPFSQVADTTLSWTNHVGVITDVSGEEPVVSESKVPVATNTKWSKFIHRSENGRVAVSRLSPPLDEQQRLKVKTAASLRMGVFYDTGFNLESERQFCSRYVREVLEDATGVQLGVVEDFSTLLKRNPQTDLGFWNIWFFGNIPWSRKTVSPASLLQDSKLHVVFDGFTQ